MFQSAPAHGGRLSHLRDSGAIEQVSIRARAWRAIPIVICFCGADECFNPRPRMAGDNAVFVIHRRPDVSIRARAWRAIGKSKLPPRPKKSFNPRPRMAGDTPLSAFLPMPRLFQSAPAHGGRFTDNANARVHIHVSIRARAWRAILATVSWLLISKVSIRARAWRAIFVLSEIRLTN